jgi:hypothetical protein
MFSLLPWGLDREGWLRLVLDVAVVPLATMDAQEGLPDLSCSRNAQISFRSSAFCDTSASCSCLSSSWPALGASMTLL